MSNALRTDGTEITGLTCDSRKVAPGFLFAALPGAKADGRAFVADAVARGASAILALPGVEAAVPTLSDTNPRRAYARLAARFHGGQPEMVAAVTGTNGKTSTVTFLRQIWTHLGMPAASIGTLGIASPVFTVESGLTTPDAADLHRDLKRLKDGGVEHLAMEASSHGLDQFRLDGVRIAAAAFTNLTRDHLDYHPSMEAYLQAKLRLFREVVSPSGAAVVNADSPAAGAVVAACQARNLKVLTYGRAGADLRLKDIRALPEGQRLDLEVRGRAFAVTLPLLGRFQAENALCALGLALALGEDPAAAVGALAGLQGPPGRLEWTARHPNGAPVVVDYAHTPDALATVLAALRPHVNVNGRLIVVFGCGGDRDPGKRPEMGRIAAEAADLAIVTDDNPRSEDPAAIRAAILAAAPGAREIADRMEAIRAAVREMKPGDLLLIAGKGHERGQIVGGQVFPFDDREAARHAVGEVSA
ncbi:MAG: UDP-N-acetylmuramoyl-L-alanyl-D-glutamate--2,6-diaminopimelate ligase [Magnetospirillum sp. WYHS-4]